MHWRESCIACYLLPGIYISFPNKMWTDTNPFCHLPLWEYKLKTKMSWFIGFNVGLICLYPFWSSIRFHCKSFFLFYSVFYYLIHKYTGHFIFLCSTWRLHKIMPDHYITSICWVPTMCLIVYTRDIESKTESLISRTQNVNWKKWKKSGRILETSYDGNEEIRKAI
jgi:hypothetical protein